MLENLLVGRHHLFRSRWWSDFFWTAGLDIKAELGITQILIEHELPLVLDLADRVAVLDFGRKIAEAAPDEVRVDPRVVEA